MGVEYIDSKKDVLTIERIEKIKASFSGIIPLLIAEHLTYSSGKQFDISSANVLYSVHKIFTLVKTAGYDQMKEDIHILCKAFEVSGIKTEVSFVNNHECIMFVFYYESLVRDSLEKMDKACIQNIALKTTNSQQTAR